MNRKNRAKSSSLFLLELILAILFFSIASAVCVQIFVKSHLLSQDAKALNLAVSECTGAAEVIRSSGSLEDTAKRFGKVYLDAKFEEKGPLSVSVYYGKDMQPCPESSGTYEMVIQLEQEDSMMSADIAMNHLSDKRSIYELHIDHHLQKEVPDES